MVTGWKAPVRESQKGACLTDGRQLFVRVAQLMEADGAHPGSAVRWICRDAFRHRFARRLAAASRRRGRTDRRAVGQPGRCGTRSTCPRRAPQLRSQVQARPLRGHQARPHSGAHPSRISQCGGHRCRRRRGKTSLLRRPPPQWDQPAPEPPPQAPRRLAMTPMEQALTTPDSAELPHRPPIGNRADPSADC